MTETDYDTLKRLMTSAVVSDRLKAASNIDSPPEVLYFLANDEDGEVRRAVAANPASPIKASQLLMRDARAEVREANAEKIARLLPNLDPQAQEFVYKLTVETLETVVADQLESVRAAVAQALCDYAAVPPQIARKLASDVERQVAEPILRYCAALSDDDLMAIISSHPASWKLVAIAQRPVVSERISGAIVETGDHDAAAALIDNIGAQLTVAAMEELLKRAENGVSQLQRAFQARENLPATMQHRIAQFVERSVYDVLEHEEDLDRATVEDVQAAVARRISRKHQQKKGEDLPAYIVRLAKEGKLNEEEIGDALAADEGDFVRLALALRADVHPGIIEKIFESRSARGITALVWRAKLSPRFALRLQQSKLGQINYRQLLYPKNAGEDFPMTTDELKWQLEFFGVK